MTRHQISASLTLDVAPLADAIAERLQGPAQPLTELSRDEAIQSLSSALERVLGLQSYSDALVLIDTLDRAGLVLTRKATGPSPETPEPGWFDRTSD